MITNKPTDQAYEELQRAYDHFNEKLFDGKLPPCLITLQRKPRTLGYYAPNNFTNLVEKGRTTDEIALNPYHFIERSLEDTLSTLVHEMAHLWRDRCSGKKASNRAYHDKLWANKMEKIGLMPSDTGEPGGNRTGQEMTHYVIKDGPFHVACQALLDHGFHLSWADNVLSWLPPEAFNPVDLQDPEALVKKLYPELPEEEWEDNFASLAAKLKKEKEGRSGKRMKYTCPSCGLNAWAKPEVALMCGTCREHMLEAE